MLDPFVLHLPFVPTASKNRQRVVRFGNRVGIRMSKAAEGDKKAIEGLALERIARMKARCNYLEGRQLSFEMTWFPHAGNVVVVVRDLGELVRLPGPRRDLSNMDAVILDALQGVVYPDDHAVRAVHLHTADT